jgi:hypothetical protein
MHKNGRFIPSVNIQWLETMINAIPQKRGVSPCAGICLVMALNYAYTTTKSPHIVFKRSLQHQFGLNYRILKSMLIQLEDKGYIRIEKVIVGKPFILTLLNIPPNYT